MGVQVPRPRRFFPPEYKAEVVELIRTTGKSAGQVARELDLTETAICEWVKRADLDAGRRSDGLTTTEHDELRRLRREVRELRKEREIRARPRFSSPGRPSPVSCYRLIDAEKHTTKSPGSPTWSVCRARATTPGRPGRRRRGR
jgi:transposase